MPPTATLVTFPHAQQYMITACFDKKSSSLHLLLLKLLLFIVGCHLAVSSVILFFKKHNAGALSSSLRVQTPSPTCPFQLSSSKASSLNPFHMVERPSPSSGRNRPMPGNALSATQHFRESLPRWWRQTRASCPLERPKLS